MKAKGKPSEKAFGKKWQEIDAYDRQQKVTLNYNAIVRSSGSEQKYENCFKNSTSFAKITFFININIRPVKQNI